MFDKQTKRAVLVTAIGVCLFVALLNLPAVLAFLGEMLGVIMPVIAGGILALFIHVPMNGIQNALTRSSRKWKRHPSEKAITVISFFTTMVCVVLVLALVLALLIPEIVTSSQWLYAQILERLASLEDYDLDIAWLEELITGLDLSDLSQKLTGAVDTLLKSVVTALSSTVGILVTAGFALIMSIYMSLGKERMCRHCRKLVQAYLPKVWADRILLFARSFVKAFTKFLTGQCTEAVILGVLMFLAFTVFRLPYGSLVGILTAVCALIPYVGAFISAVVSVLLTLLIAPELALRCLIVYLVVQFIENQFIYPKVVGESVGLPPLYTLIAAMIGGKLFGIMGILFFIPLSAVILELVKVDANQRICQKEKVR